MRLGFIGAGRVGTGLAVGLSRCGYDVVSVASRTYASAQALAARVPGCRAEPSPQSVVDAADIVFITTPDDAIELVVSQLRWRPGVGVVHCSGARSTRVLASAEMAGGHTGALHPLQSFPDIASAPERLTGITYAVESTEPLFRALTAMVDALGGRCMRLSADCRALYHASAVLASNYVVTLLKLATDLWRLMGVDKEVALSALLPLVQGTVDSLQRMGLPAAITGPVSRGDVGTLHHHLVVLQQAAPQLLNIYRELALETVELALDKGTITGPQAEVMTHLVMEAAAPLETALSREPVLARS